MKNWYETLLEKCGAVVEHYEKSAPTVSEWANGLFMRMEGAAGEVRLTELFMIEDIRGEHPTDWMAANYAANVVYKLMHRLGQDTTGHAGF